MKLKGILLWVSKGMTTFCFVGLSAAMKYSLIVAVVVLALAQGTVWPSHNHFSFRSQVFFLSQKTNFFFGLWEPTGSFAQEAELEQINQYFQDAREKLAKYFSNPDLASHAQWVESAPQSKCYFCFQPEPSLFQTPHYKVWHLLGMSGIWTLSDFFLVSVLTSYITNKRYEPFITVMIISG